MSLAIGLCVSMAFLMFTGSAFLTTNLYTDIKKYDEDGAIWKSILPGTFMCFVSIAFGLVLRKVNQIQKQRDDEIIKYDQVADSVNNAGEERIVEASTAEV